MQQLTALIVLVLPLLAAASCRATDAPDPPATQPTTPTTATTITASATVAQEHSAWVVEVTLTNTTDRPLSTGRYMSFTLTRVDTQPTQVVAKTPEQTMAPHFRVALPVGESRKASVVVWDKPEPLAAGRYHAAVTFPADMLSAPVEADFTVSGAATQAN